MRERAGTTAATLAAWWTCPLLCKAARELYYQGWKFGPDDQGHEAMGLMLVLGVGCKPTLAEVRLALGHLLKDHVLPAGRPSTGSPVFLESTPFGSGSLFLNSWSSGVISAVTGTGSSLLLCDVHAAPGCEGGALYSRSGPSSGAHIAQDSGSDPRCDVPRPGAPRLVGLVVLPFSVVRGEAVALCLCAALGPVLAQLLGLQPSAVLEPGEKINHYQCWLIMPTKVLQTSGKTEIIF